MVPSKLQSMTFQMVCWEHVNSFRKNRSEEKGVGVAGGGVRDGGVVRRGEVREREVSSEREGGVVG